MSDHSATPAAHGHDAHAAHGGHDAPADAGHGTDTHGHDGPGLGPIDWKMWGIGVLGVLAALIVAAGFVVATSFSFVA